MGDCLNNGHAVRFQILRVGVKVGGGGRGIFSILSACVGMYCIFSVECVLSHLPLLHGKEI